MAWSVDNPVIGEFEDLVPQPLPYRTTFVPADQAPEPASLPIDAAPEMVAISHPALAPLPCV